jgi:Tfp pilus assembly protein PilF
MRGLVALQRRRVDEARRSFEAALAIDPYHVEALSGLSTIDAAAGRLGVARARVEAKIKSNQKPSTDLLFLAAKTCVTTNDPDCVESYLRRIVQADPNNLETYNLLGQFYLARGKTKEAKREFEAIVQREPTAAGAHTMLGLLYQSEDDLERATKSFERALAIDPRAGAAANNLAWIYANKDGGDLDAALVHAQSARGLMPASTAAADTLAFVYYKKGMGSFAVNLLDQAISVEPKNPIFHYHLGLVYAQAGEDSKARRSLETALKLNPSFAGADNARKVISSLIY